MAGGDAVARRWPLLSLRLRLTLVAVVLAGLGLVAAGIATHVALESFLVDRLDDQFEPAEVPTLLALADRDPRAARRAAEVLPTGSYAALIAPGGDVVRSLVPRTEESDGLPAAVPRARHGYSTDAGFRLYAVDMAELFADRDDPFDRGFDAVPPDTATLVIAMPTDDVTSTLHRLALLEALIGVAVLAGVAAAAYAVIRREFRPLRRIEATAGAIADGDLSRRVDDADPRTEVGRLGASLNVMLAQIEGAFAERRASEDRLRRFVADASHELRTPLTSVRGYAELFRRGAAERPEDLAVVMGRIEAEAERMGVLVEDLLLLAQLDQGRPLQREPVALDAVVGEMARDHALLHPDWPIAFETDGPVVLEGDESRIRQAVGNLLANARAHTAPGTPVTAAVRADGAEAVVEVGDAGPGIEPAVAGRVFERFFRADPSRARASGGAGLGLAIVAAIAEAHGGRAEVESAPGAGAVFRLRLPRAVAAGAAPTVADEARRDADRGG